MTTTTTTSPPRKTVLITGCSDNGIGSGLAHAFHTHHYHVFATARSPSKITTLRSLPHVTLLPLDTTSASSIAAAVEAVTARTGGVLDVLVNNAGVNCVGPAVDEDVWGDAREVFGVNVFGTMAVTKAFAPLVVAAEGCVVNNSSLSAVLHLPFWSTYAASKAAITAYTETLRLEMVPFNVRVLCLHTGAVRTNIFSNFTPFSLPPNSLYLPLKPRMEAIMRGEDIGPGEYMDIQRFGEQVVRDVEAGRSGIVWRGGMAGTVRWTLAVLPGWLWDLITLHRNKMLFWKPKQD